MALRAAEGVPDGNVPRLIERDSGGARLLGSRSGGGIAARIPPGATAQAARPVVTTGTAGYLSPPGWARAARAAVRPHNP
jgi:hypothetical protein